MPALGGACTKRRGEAVVAADVLSSCKDSPACSVTPPAGKACETGRAQGAVGGGDCVYHVAVMVWASLGRLM